MNEELMKEFIAILRAMKDETPAAWQVLVEQRVTYCLTVAIAATLVALALGAISFLSARVAYRSMDDGPQIAGTVAAGVTAAGCLIGLTASIGYWAEGFAPLGRMLEVLR